MDILPEQKALDILEKYQGTNDYINELRYKVSKRNFPLNRNQSEYIINNHEYKPKIAKKYIKIDEYFGKKIMEELLLPIVPNQIWVEKLLTESDKAYHILGKRYSGETMCHFWIPKTQIIPDKKDKYFEIDYTKYEHRMPMDHQKSAVQKLLNNDKFILADDMGVGKSLSAVVGSIESEAKKILIVCPKSLKLNWRRELEHYTDPNDITIIDGKKWSSAKYIIINYDILKNFHSLDKEESITTLINENFDLAIIDEAHAISNSSSKRSKLVNDILSKINKVWLLTGTPVTSRPINYYNLLKVIGNPVANNWIYYIRRYCDGKQIFMGRKRIWKTDGATNLEELHEKTKHQMLRRLKEDVLDLPEKIRTPIYLKMNSAEYEQEMGEYLNWLDENQDKSLSIQLNKIVKIRQIIANEKIPYTIELTENALDQDKKVVIFTNFTEPLMKLHEYFGKKSVILHGQMKDDDRQKSIDNFQNDPNIKIFISNMKAGGVGITLTAAEVEIMNDLPFVPYLALQCEDRAYRKGQRNNVSIFYPLFENTMEMIIYNMLNTKQQNINTIIGDAEDDVFKIVLENLK